MEGNNLPLALNPWADPSAPNSYLAAREAVDMVFNPERDAFLRAHPELAEFTRGALYGIIMEQSERNFEQFEHVRPILTKNHDDYVKGRLGPADLTLFLHATVPLNSIETARRTEKEWNTYHAVDGPVRHDLDEHPLLYTKAIKSEPVYHIKNLNLMGVADQQSILVNRKRTVRQHFGGEVLTIVRNSFVLHNRDDEELPRDIRVLIHEEREKARHDGNYKYRVHFDTLRDHMENYIINRSHGDKPGWMMPLMTTYYAARRRAISTKQLLHINETETVEIT
jgi:hypothetical protein